MDLMKDCTKASFALSQWFQSQGISQVKAVLVMSILLTGVADIGTMSDKKIDKTLRHVRTLTRALLKQTHKSQKMGLNTR